MKKLLLLVFMIISSINALQLINATQEVLFIKLKLNNDAYYKFTLPARESAIFNIATKVAKLKIDSELRCGSSCKKHNSRCLTIDKFAPEGTIAGSHDSLLAESITENECYTISRIYGFLNLRKN